MRKEFFIPTKKTKPKKLVPHAFVLDYLSEAGPMTKPMFGCTSIYVDDKIVLILREKDSMPQDNGVWLATTAEHHKSLKKDFPKMRSITIFGEKSSWQLLPSDASDFEESAIRACELILKRDPRIGKVPASRLATSKKKKKPLEI